MKDICHDSTCAGQIWERKPSKRVLYTPHPRLPILHSKFALSHRITHYRANNKYDCESNNYSFFDDAFKI